MSARLKAIEMRHDARYPADLVTIVEHRRLGELPVRLVNLSAGGCMAEGLVELELAERVVVRLPLVGRIEAHRSWSAQGRTGLQFERMIRLDDLAALIEQLDAGRDGARAV